MVVSLMVTDCAEVYVRFMRERTASEPDCAGMCSQGMTRGTAPNRRIMSSVMSKGLLVRKRSRSIPSIAAARSFSQGRGGTSSQPT